LTDLLNNSVVAAPVPVLAPDAPKKHGWLPLLTVLFCISYALMTMLIVEQGHTIESQRALIRELFRDSSELNAAKMKAQQEKAAAAHAQSHGQVLTPQNPSSQKPLTQAPITQAPLTQAPSNQAPSMHAQQQAPSSQAVPSHSKQTEKEKQRFQPPSRPATDQADDARAVITI
jgi:hypothetical protein